MAMKFPNMISTTISDKDLKDILTCIHGIDEKLSDLVTLTEEELTALPKTRKNTIEFVKESLKLAEKYPDLVPKNIDIGEVKKDVELIKAIDMILGSLKALVKKLEDSEILAGSEAYLPSLAIYNAVKTRQAVKRRPKEKEKV